jgi:hypothetical protein
VVLLAAAGCSPRAASSESAASPTTTPATMSFEAVGQTTTTASPTTQAGTVTVAIGSATDSSSPTDGSGAEGTDPAASQVKSDPVTTVEMSVITPPTNPPPPPPPLSVGERRPDGTVPVVVEPTVTRFTVRYRDNDGDPYYQVRTTPDFPFLFDVELYTESGVGWTGQLGQFSTDCELNGICVYLRLAPSTDALDANPVAMIADPLGKITIGKLSGGIQLHLQQLRFRALGSEDVFVLDDLQLDLVPPS